MRPWRQSKPRSKMTSGLKPVRVWNERLDGGCNDGSDARYRGQPSHVLVTLCLNDNRTFELVDPLLRPLNLIGKFAESQARRRRQASVLLITYDLNQCRSLRPASACYNAEFRQMGAQRVDGLRPLADKNLARLQNHCSRLLVDRFYRHKSHSFTDHSFADCLRICRIGFTTLHERLYVGWRDQPHVMAKLGNLPCPKMRPSAGLHSDQARRQLLEKGQHVSPTQLATGDRTTVRLSAVNLKYLLGQIQTNGGNLFHGSAPCHVVVATTTLWHTDAVIAGPFHTSKRANQVTLAPELRLSRCSTVRSTQERILMSP